MDSTRGWIGSIGQFLYTMRTMGAAEDWEGNILVAGEPPAAFLGLGGEQNDLVVSERVLVQVGGRWVPAVGLLSMTSYGAAISVI